LELDSTAVTLALATTAPVESVTRPERVARNSWVIAVEAEKRLASKQTTAVRPNELICMVSSRKCCLALSQI
jgi:hypothetical protein